MLMNALRDGLLSFPITDFDKNGNFNRQSFKDRLEWFTSFDISAVFVAGGTGEFFSINRQEYEEIVRVTGETVQHLPLISSVGRSVVEAREWAQIAKDHGMHALLLMPPYLTECPREGVLQYAEAIMSSTDLPVIYYNRANGVLTTKELVKLAERCPNFIGLKDGTGQMQELNDTIKTLGDRLIYIGGVPTAEIIAEAYLSLGVNTYSSAVFNFVPELALRFYKALRSGDRETVSMIIKDFFIPFVHLRNQKQGYAVSLIKAGAQIIGRDAGKVRPPLVMPSDDEVEILRKIIDKIQA